MSYYHVSLATYDQEENMVQEERLAEFEDYEKAEEFVSINIHLPITVWCDRFVETAWGHMPGLIWTDNYRKEWKKITCGGNEI